MHILLLNIFTYYGILMKFYANDNGIYIYIYKL